jgi:myo-inositol-1(or 4)-monophosphatase
MRLARTGGRIALEHFEEVQASWKPDGSMVTAADLAIEARLRQEIEEAFPGDGVLGEENGMPRGGRLAARHVWIVDPIDGTNNFGRGMPGFSISIGVFRDGLPHCGAVYDPLTEQLFAGVVGGGAWANGRPLRLAASPPSPRSLFSIRSPYDGEVPGFVQRWLCTYRLRRFGSTALQLCYVALGALAFVHDQRASLWDIAGAAPIVLEAGGMLTSAAGRELFPIDPGHYTGEPIAFLAGDAESHRAALSDVAGAARPAS